VTISLDVTLLVLFAALMHASWNAIVKSSASKFLDIVAIAIVPGVIAMVAVAFLPWPDRASWPWLAASAAIHFFYFLAVAAAYRHGDLSHVYPLMRGCAPLLVALSASAGLAEKLTSGMWVGVLLISAGIVVPALVERRVMCSPRRGTLIALGNAVIIAAYTIVDGVGARLSGSAISYGQWLFLLNALPLTVVALALFGGEVGGYLRERWAFGLAGGIMSMAAYAIVLWAMTKAPVAAVAALRETSVIIAAGIGSLILREGVGVPRIIGAVFVACGVAALKL